MITIQQAIDEYMQHLEARGLAKGTLKLYADHLWHMAEVLEGRSRHVVSTVQHKDLDAWAIELNRMGLSSGVRRDRIFLAKRFFKWLHERGDLLANPARDLPIPKKVDPLPENPPDADAMARMLDTTPVTTPMAIRDKALLEVLYGCLLRISEALNLNVSQVNFDDQTLAVRGKGRKDRVIPLPKRTLQSLLAYLDVRPALLKHRRSKSPHSDARKALFISSRGLRLSREGASDIVKLHGQAAGIADLHPHLLRHAGAVHMLRAGADIRHIQELLDHSDPEMTKRYLRLIPGDLKTAYDAAFPVLRV